MGVDTPVAAVLALWNDVDPIHDADYNDWHANEHVPERLTVPGMLWGLRFLATAGVAGPRYLTLYGLRDAQVLDSAAYQHLLAWPTPMSARMRRVMHGISRAVYDVVATQGSLAASGLLLSEDQDLGQPTPTPGEIDAAPGLLRGLRRPDTQPLPWLQTGQSGFQPPLSLRLIALAAGPMALKAPAVPGVSRYRRLPVSGDGQF
ncbi:DUF4286 family protein [Hylemonella gracilis]|uniref:Uncharacterized protein n=1 Tax=Hylemonella gracilis ATCC 19624 TaxID=887062 RepID=F3KU21_9BURK|nr:DUF4286 family protein [Hylemonella gracilis]EGI76704.1 hypothetical protein HGR_09765 [Hylemonella gracilis ATCC 19624]